ncbi:MAG: hypothetical protein H0W83_12350 [Planctomycetes bacterium]|nr:hypothetical protein [Planctomycetota bacterium]
MGAIGGNGQMGQQGQPGPPGPPGPPGGIDPFSTALAVFARAVMPPQQLQIVGQWVPLSFDIPEWDTHRSLQPGGRFSAPIRGTYCLYANLLFQPVNPNMVLGLRVIRNGGNPEFQRIIAMPSSPASIGSAEITAIALLSPGESLHVEYQLYGPGPYQIYGGPPRSCLVVAGVGVSQ